MRRNPLTEKMILLVLMIKSGGQSGLGLTSGKARAGTARDGKKTGNGDGGAVVAALKAGPHKAGATVPRKVVGGHRPHQAGTRVNRNEQSFQKVNSKAAGNCGAIDSPWSCVEGSMRSPKREAGGYQGLKRKVMRMGQGKCHLRAQSL